MSLVLQSSGGGQITIQEPATASNFTATMPAATGDVMVSGNMPAFRVYPSAVQNLTTGTNTKLTFNTEVFDTNNCYDSTTNYRFTPNVAGYYQLNAYAQIQGFATGNTNLIFYRNGSQYSLTEANVIGSTGNYPTLYITDIIYFNGTTDYVELYALQGSGSTRTIYGGASPNYSWWSGSMIRGA
jgi:hypothetical protein